MLRYRVLVVCVGPITATPLAHVGVPVIQPARARIGALVRELAVALPARAPRVRVRGEVTLELRGQAVLVDEELRPVRRRRWPCCARWPSTRAGCCRGGCSPGVLRQPLRPRGHGRRARGRDGGGPPARGTRRAEPGDDRGEARLPPGGGPVVSGRRRDAPTLVLVAHGTRDPGRRRHRPRAGRPGSGQVPDVRVAFADVRQPDVTTVLRCCRRPRRRGAGVPRRRATTSGSTFPPRFVPRASPAVSRRTSAADLVRRRPRSGSSRPGGVAGQPVVLAASGSRDRRARDEVRAAAPPARRRTGSGSSPPASPRWPTCSPRTRRSPAGCSRRASSTGGAAQECGRACRRRAARGASGDRPVDRPPVPDATVREHWVSQAGQALGQRVS